jgi:large subunit ribosomal protein L17
MGHRIAGKQLGRSVGQRNALRRTMITQLLHHERIVTTRAKAESIRGAAEHMITQVKRALANPAAKAEEQTARLVHLQRVLAGRLDDKDVVAKLVAVLGPRYQDRPGGYTRIYRLGPRKGDGAEMVVLELVDRPSKTDDDSASSAGGAARRGGIFSRLRRGGQADTPKSE